MNDLAVGTANAQKTQVRPPEGESFGLQFDLAADRQWRRLRRREFPIFTRYPQWSYLDSAATAQKPQSVIDALEQFWSQANAPLHRGVYRLSAEVTRDYELARQKVQGFVGAASSQEIVFCRGTTAAINLLAHSFVGPRLRPGDNVVITALEHHANFVPWQQLCQRVGAELRIIPLQRSKLAGRYGDHLHCQLDLAAAEDLLDSRSRLLAVSAVSNALGTVNPVAELCRLAAAQGVPSLVDGAQAVAHGPVDVQDLGCDFYAFSGHKLYGPDGIGVLYGRRERLEEMTPYQTGGDMIDFVSAEEVTFAPVPQRFEAGTMPVSAVLGLGCAIDYMQLLAAAQLRRSETALLAAASSVLEGSPELSGLRIVGHESDLQRKVGIISFVIEGLHPHDLASILDSQDVAVRAGHHCAQPLMASLGLVATSRVSFGVYNDESDVQRLAAGLEKAIAIMAR